MGICTLADGPGGLAISVFPAAGEGRVAWSSFGASASIPALVADAFERSNRILGSDYKHSKDRKSSAVLSITPCKHYCLLEITKSFQGTLGASGLCLLSRLCA